MSDQPIIRVDPIVATLELTTIQELLVWFRHNLCSVMLRDPRGYRVRFLPTDFVHFIKLTNKFGREPRNATLVIEEIERGRIKFVEGRYSPQRAGELSWCRHIVESPTLIVPNWQPLGRLNSEAYIKNFGAEEKPRHRVLICEVIGNLRRPVTLFPRERFNAAEIAIKLWP